MKHRGVKPWDTGEHLPHASMALLISDIDYRGKRRNCTCGHDGAGSRIFEFGCPAHGDATDELVVGYVEDNTTKDSA